VCSSDLIGARDQILARLEERFADKSPALLADLGVSDPEQVDALLWEAAGYLARTTLESIGTLFQRADRIKSWLTNSARAVATQEQPMCWITPLGLPTVQPYRRTQAMIVKTSLQGLSVADADEQLPVSVQKQGSAFPPNYVHSLDSSHMLMTAIDCSRRGLVFAAVHDSYWTLPRDVDVINASLRDQFVRLYSLPLLEQLRDSLRLRFPGLDIPELPGYGELDLELVRDSPYFFS
jgi:DNA-directed RNA polymerase